MPEILGEEQEQRIFDALRAAIELTNAGTDPSEAIAKVASQHRFSPQVACRMCEAFNTSKSLSIFRTKKGAARTELFTLADPVRALGIMYPSAAVTPAQEKAAVFSPTEGLDPEQRDFQKVAYAAAEVGAPAISQDIEQVMRRAYYERDRLHKAAELAELDVYAARRAVQDSVVKLAEWFRRLDFSADSFDRVDAVVQGHHGEAGKRVMDAVWQLHKDAGVALTRATKVATTIAPDREPYNFVNAVLAAAQEYQKAAAVYALAVRNSAEFDAMLKVKLAAVREKRGAIPGDALVSNLVMDPVKNLFGSAESAGGVPAAVANDMADPVYESQRRAIQAQLALQELMANDEVISRHDPAHVVRVYNQLVSSYPRLASSGVGLQVYLRRMLEGGGLDPVDVSEATGTEQRLSTLEQPGNTQRKALMDA